MTGTGRVCRRCGEAWAYDVAPGQTEWVVTMATPPCDHDTGPDRGEVIDGEVVRVADRRVDGACPRGTE